jgi:tissue inhibitor of metalloproteinase
VKSDVSLYSGEVRLRRRGIAAVVVLGALVFAGSAQACSCAPRNPVDALSRADAAIVARLVKVVPRGSLRADYRYRVRRVYRGARMIDRGETISVRSARRAAACGLPRRQGHAVGLFLLRDERGHWTAGICSTISPRRLWQAAHHGYDRRRPAAHSSCAS